MAISPLMAWRAGYSGSVQALRVLNGTTLETTQLGAATGFTAAAWDTSTLGPTRHNRIIEFRGDLYVLHVGTGRVYQFVFGSKTWTSVHTLSPVPNVNSDNTVGGFEVVDVDGEARLYFFFKQSASAISHGRWSNDGTTWNNTASPPSVTSGWHNILNYNGKLYVLAGDPASTGGIISYDPSADSWITETIVGTAITNTSAGAIINFKGRLLVAGPTRSNVFASPMYFKELVGGGFNDVTYSGGSDPGDMVGGTLASTLGSVFAFEDGDKLYVLWNQKTVDVTGNSAGQVRVSEFVPNGATPGSSWQENDISSTVVPAAWLTGGAFDTVYHHQSAFMGYAELSTPGTPEIYAWRHTNTGIIAQSTFWTWNGNATLMTVVNSDVTPEVQVARGPNTTGEVIYTEGDFDVTLENAVIKPGKITFDFQAHTPLDASSPSAKQGKLYYSIGGTDWLEATLSTAGGDAPTVVSGGDPAPTISTNTLQNITVGASVFRATWDAVTDGFTAAGTQVELLLDVF